MTLLDRQHDANATQPMDAPADAYTVPVRQSGPLSHSSSGTHRIYATDDGKPKRITRPVTGPLPELERENDPLAGQPRAKCPTTIIKSGQDARNEAWRRLKDDGKLHMTTTVTGRDGTPIRVTIAGRIVQGCYFQMGQHCQIGDFALVWNDVTRMLPQLKNATWAFAPWANFDEACWAKVEAAYNQWRRKGA